MKIMGFEEFTSEAFGGNSGYVGYSMSVRAANARRDGRFPKTDFMKEYGMARKVFDSLLSLGYITGGEWHHTSKFGNKTVFYSFRDEACAGCWEKHGGEITGLLSGGDDDGVRELFDAYAIEYEEDRSRRNAEASDRLKEYSEYAEKYRKAHDRFDSSAPFKASNGCTVSPDGETVTAPDGTVLTKRHGKNLRDAAREEYKEARDAWKKGLVPFDKYFGYKHGNGAR